MRTPRVLVAANPLHFGRGRAWLASVPYETSLTDFEHLKLFATTFAAGFLFVSVLIA